MPTSPSSVAEKNVVLAVLREAADDAVDLRLEAEVEHPVGLVKNEDLQAPEVDEPPLGEILQPAGVATRMWAPLMRLAWARSGTPP